MLSQSNVVKTGGYLVLSGVQLALAVWIQSAIRTAGALESGYALAVRLLFLAAIAYTGTAVFSLREFSKKRGHRGDSAVLLTVGLALMGLWGVVTVAYGGMDAPFGSVGYFACNLMIAAWGVLPLPVLIRGGVLAFRRAGEPSVSRRVLQVSFFAVLLAYMLAAVLGGVWRMVRYPADAAFSSGYEDSLDEESPAGDYAGL